MLSSPKRHPMPTEDELCIMACEVPARCAQGYLIGYMLGQLINMRSPELSRYVNTFCCPIAIRSRRLYFP